LTTKGVNYRTINLEERLSADALQHLLQSAGLRPPDALRKNEEAYRQYVDGRNLSDDQLVRVMADHPELIQRPIVARGDKAVLARPVERLAELGVGFEPDR
jgi:arsenate reductase (glutaredoxin)